MENLRGELDHLALGNVLLNTCRGRQPVSKTIGIYRYVGFSEITRLVGGLARVDRDLLAIRGNTSNVLCVRCHCGCGEIMCL